MSTEIPRNIKRRYLQLGFKLEKGVGYWMANRKINYNEHISVNNYGQVYVYKGFDKLRTGNYSPILINRFTADTLAKIEVLVEPLLE